MLRLRTQDDLVGFYLLGPECITACHELYE